MRKHPVQGCRLVKPAPSNKNMQRVLWSPILGSYCCKFLKMSATRVADPAVPNRSQNFGSSGARHCTSANYRVLKWCRENRSNVHYLWPCKKKWGTLNFLKIAPKQECRYRRNEVELQILLVIKKRKFPKIAANFS